MPNLLTTIASSRRRPSASPSARSEAPMPYPSAVSKQLTPRSSARPTARANPGSSTSPEPTRDVGDRRRAGGAGAVRRAPFSDNPQVGARGQRTQQRILDAALRVFAEKGYHRASIDRIAKAGGCSRVSFYQYFASKEDVFQHLAGQVERQVTALTEALDPLTRDLEAWTALRTWVARYAEIYARYEPVFNAYESDEVLATVAGSTGKQTITRIHSRLGTTTLPARQLDPVIRLLLECLNHTLEVAGVLRSVVAAAYPGERDEHALTDVM